MLRVEPLKSNGPADQAATPPETKPEEQPVQVAQLSAVATAIAQAMKKIPGPRKRPLSAWPRPDDLVVRDVTAPTPEGECDAAMNSGILVAQRLQRLGHRGSCMVPYALRLDAIMVGPQACRSRAPAQVALRLCARGSPTGVAPKPIRRQMRWVHSLSVSVSSILTIAAP